MKQVTPTIFTNTNLRGCNPSFVVTSDGVVVIDTPQLPTRAVAMRAEAESHGPIRYLILASEHNITVPFSCSKCTTVSIFFSCKIRLTSPDEIFLQSS